LAHQIGAQGNASGGIVGFQKRAEAAVDLSFQVLSQFGVFSKLANQSAYEGSKIRIEGFPLCIVFDEEVSIRGFHVHTGCCRLFAGRGRRMIVMRK
jgi:hypothetical protein